MGQDGSLDGVFGQKFAADGAPVGTEFQVNSYTTGYQSRPSVAMDADGDFVVVWDSPGQDGDGLGIFGQRFAADGTMLGGEFQINTYTTSVQILPRLAMDANGKFVVTWTSVDQDGSGIVGQRFSADGTPEGGEFQVNSYTTAGQLFSSVGMDSNGDFVVVWTSGQDGHYSGIFGQQFRVTASIGDRVWSDVNFNGIQDMAESGISGVTVNLFEGGSATQLETAVTDANGNYLFEGIAPWDYFLEFVLPQGFVFTTSDQGLDDTGDSDADPATGRTVVTSLAEAEVDLSWDAGMVGTSLGDRVWLDGNVNGIQDPGEPGVGEVTVNLFNASTGLIAGATSTDSNGLYRFRPLPPADYFLQFVLPGGFIFTAPDQGADDTLDSDANVSTGRTAVTTLSENEMDLSLDAGLAPDDFLTLGVNQSAFGTSDTLRVSVLVNNTGSPSTADFFGAVLPDGDTIVFFTDLAFNASVGRLSDVSTLSPMVSGVNLSAPFVFRGPGFFNYTWTGGEPPGTYLVFLAAVVPGALTDGTVDPGDILGLNTATFMFAP